MKIPSSWFLQNDVVTLSKEILGKYLYTAIDGEVTGGRIVETEAYKGPEDRGSHAFGNRNTDRTRVMFGPGGYSYVYLCYGIHHLFNIVSGEPGNPHAILIRGLEPTEGLDIMLRRRSLLKPSYRISAGPGAVAQALGLDRRHTNLPVDGSAIWIEEKDDKPVEPGQIECRPRVGMNFEGTYHSIAWRFSIKGNAWVSRAK